MVKGKGKGEFHALRLEDLWRGTQQNNGSCAFSIVFLRKVGVISSVDFTWNAPWQGHIYNMLSLYFSITMLMIMLLKVLPLEFRSSMGISSKKLQKCTLGLDNEL